MISLRKSDAHNSSSGVLVQIESGIDQLF